jgi:hypothetical protein
VPKERRRESMKVKILMGLIALNCMVIHAMEEVKTKEEMDARFTIYNDKREIDNLEADIAKFIEDIKKSKDIKDIDDLLRLGRETHNKINQLIREIYDLNDTYAKRLLDEEALVEVGVYQETNDNNMEKLQKLYSDSEELRKAKGKEKANGEKKKKVKKPVIKPKEEEKEKEEVVGEEIIDKYANARDLIATIRDVFYNAQLYKIFVDNGEVEYEKVLKQNLERKQELLREWKELMEEFERHERELLTKVQYREGLIGELAATIDAGYATEKNEENRKEIEKNRTILRRAWEELEEGRPGITPALPEFRVAPGYGLPEEGRIKLQKDQAIIYANRLKAQFIDPEIIFERLKQQFPELDLSLLANIAGLELEEEIPTFPIPRIVPAPSRTVSVPSGNLLDLLTDLRNRLRTMKGVFGR